MSTELLEWAAIGVDATGVGVMLPGFVFAVARFISTIWEHKIAAAISQIQEIRCSLGIYLVFALELMIVSDLLHSVLSRELDDLYFLAAIVAMRTVIGFFLNKERQEIRLMRAGS